MQGKKNILWVIVMIAFAVVQLVTVSIHAAGDSISKIEIETEPKLKEYCVGDVFQSRGLSLNVIYESGESKVITEGYSVEYDFSTAGEKVVEIAYTENGQTFSVNYNVTVYEKPVIYSEARDVKRGETFSVPVFISGNCGIMGLQVKVEYDKDLLLPISVDHTEFFTEGTIDDSIATSLDNTFQVIWTGTKNIGQNGKLFDITFLCKENTSQLESAIKISTVNSGTYNENYSTITCTAAQSNIKVSEKSKKNLTDLTVFIKDWVYGATASVPVITGNTGNGAVTYYYASQTDSIYSSAVPTEVGNYILKIVVAATEEYNSGIATCSFKITAPPKQEETVQPEPPQQPEQSAKITLSKPQIKSVTNIKGKKAVIKIKKKVTNASGYEIRYSTTKSMKSYKKAIISKSKLSKTVSGLKKGKYYYFKVRAYKKVNGKIYYSKWSTVKKIKIKK